jgi:hypothetical protein
VAEQDAVQSVRGEVGGEGQEELETTRNRSERGGAASAGG